MKTISAVKAKFSRLNIKASHTKLWVEMSEEKRDFVVRNTELLIEEAIILCFFPNTSYWWALTNMSLILYENGNVSYFYLSEIENIEVKEIFNNEKTKQDCVNLDIHLPNNNIKLKVEENTWHAIYSILKFVIN
ncbi:hypothetical protein [Spirosoma areae]